MAKEIEFVQIKDEAIHLTPVVTYLTGDEGNETLWITPRKIPVEYQKNSYTASG